MKKSVTRAVTIGLTLICILGFIGYQKANEEKRHIRVTTTPASNVEDTATTEPESQNEVFQFLSDKYDLMFQLWGPEGHDLYVFRIYPDHADYECHIMMPENTDDVEQYRNDLQWKIEDDELIITNYIGGEWTETFKIDISSETAISTTTGRVFQIYEIEPPPE